MLNRNRLGELMEKSQKTRRRIVALSLLFSLRAACGWAQWPDDGFGAINGYVRALAVQTDGNIVVAGDFTRFDTATVTVPENTGWRYRLGRLTSSGALTSFRADANGVVRGLAIQPDGKILVVGEFTTLGGVTRNHIGRLNADGSVDTAFNPGANHDVYTVALRADGKIVVGGAFSALGGGHGAVSRNYIGVLNADGSVDSA